MYNNIIDSRLPLAIKEIGHDLSCEVVKTRGLYKLCSPTYCRSGARFFCLGGIFGAQFLLFYCLHNCGRKIR